MRIKIPVESSFLRFWERALDPDSPENVDYRKRVEELRAAVKKRQEEDLEYERIHGHPRPPYIPEDFNPHIHGCI